MKHQKTSGREKQSLGKSAPNEKARRCCRKETLLEIPVGEPDLVALRSVMRDWLVPRLVEDFLRERGIDLKYAHVQVPRNPNSKT